MPTIEPVAFWGFVSALAGALIGAMSVAGVFLYDRRTQERAACRVITEELRGNALYAEMVTTTGKWPGALKNEAWQSYRVAAARRLPPETYARVAAPYGNLDYYKSEVERLRGSGSSASNSDLLTLETMRMEILTAARLLARTAYSARDLKRLSENEDIRNATDAANVAEARGKDTDAVLAKGQEIQQRLDALAQERDAARGANGAPSSRQGPH